MKRIAIGFVALFVFSVPIFSQKYTSKLKKVELVSPISEQKQAAKGKQIGCYSFVNENTLCDDRPSDLYYGTLQAGNDLDWFQIMGAGSRNKIINLGSKKWKDKFKVPIVEPYAKLKDGEKREVGLDVSGNNGKKGKDGEKGVDGLPGRNGDGSITLPKINKEIPPAKPEEIPLTDSTSKTKQNSNYNPFEKAFVGNMYVMRVVDENKDFYVVFRVDKLERGKKIKISWRRVLAPENS